MAGHHSRLSRRRLLQAAGSTSAILLAGCTAGLTQEDLRVAWTTTRQTEYDGNHHAMAGTVVDSTPMVAAPLNDFDGSDRCGLIAVTADGDIEWDDRRPPGDCTPHGVSDVGVGALTTPDRAEFLLATETGDIYAYDAATGDQTMHASVFESLGYSAPTILSHADTRLLVGVDFEGTVVAVRPDGTVAWRDNLGSNVPLDPLVDDFDGDGAPEIAVSPRRPDRVVSYRADGEVYVDVDIPEQPRSWTRLSQSNRVDLAIATRTGQIRFLDGTDGTQFTGPAVGSRPRVGSGAPRNTSVFVADERGQLAAINPDSGEKTWEQSIVDDQVDFAAPAVGTLAGGPVVAVAGGDGTVAIYEAVDGELLARRRLDGPIHVPPVFVGAGDSDDALFALLGDGRITRLTYHP